MKKLVMCLAVMAVVASPSVKAWTMKEVLENCARVEAVYAGLALMYKYGLIPEIEVHVNPRK